MAIARRGVRRRASQPQRGIRRRLRCQRRPEGRWCARTAWVHNVVKVVATVKKDHRRALCRKPRMTYGSSPIGPMLAVRDNYPKTLITLDDERPVSHEGIEQAYALDWPLGDENGA